MQITDIKQQVKTVGRYSIFVDGKYCFGISEGGLLEHKLKVGQELSDEEVSLLKDVSFEDKIYNLAINLIVRRPRSIWEINQYFKRKDIDQDLSNKLVKRLIEKKWLDDYEFARKWIENRKLLKPISQRKLIQELKLKRVSDQIIKDLLLNQSQDEKSILNELVRRKTKQTRYQDKTKLMAYLLRQGFNYSDIKEVINLDIDSEDSDY